MTFRAYFSCVWFKSVHLVLSRTLAANLVNLLFQNGTLDCFDVKQKTEKLCYSPYLIHNQILVRQKESWREFRLNSQFIMEILEDAYLKFHKLGPKYELIPGALKLKRVTSREEKWAHRRNHINRVSCCVYNFVGSPFTVLFLRHRVVWHTDPNAIISVNLLIVNLCRSLSYFGKFKYRKIIMHDKVPDLYKWMISGRPGLTDEKMFSK